MNIKGSIPTETKTCPFSDPGNGPHAPSSQEVQGPTEVLQGPCEYPNAQSIGIQKHLSGRATQETPR